jgi:plastocyanin
MNDGSVSVPIPAGTTKTVTVNITQTTGWHCSIHKSMTGTLTVA